MTTVAPCAPAAGRASGRTRFQLSGLTWLVWRRHRASFRLWILCSLALTGYLVYWHTKYQATFAADTCCAVSRSFGFPPDVGLSVAACLLFIAPFPAGVAFGAQLFEREFTDGTFTLACTQSASAAAWVRAKLSVPAAMVLLCVTPCAAALTWDYRVNYSWQQNWHGIGVFDVIGPVAVADCLVGLFLGAASGLTWRRGGPAKGLALILVIAFKAGLFWLLPHLLPSTYTAIGPTNDLQTLVPVKAWALDSGYLNGGGQYVRYLPYSDLQPLQWIATGVCVIVCAALFVYCLRLVRRLP